MATVLAMGALLLATMMCTPAHADSNPLVRSQTFVLNPLVPLTHCVTFGVENEFRLEWTLSLAPKWTLELRYTANLQKGYSSLGFQNGTQRQIITGYPVEYIHCSRQLFDNFSPYDVDGNVYPNFPEVPGKITSANTSHVVHYIMRNLTVTSREFLEDKKDAPLNVTLLWSFMQESLFESGCYMGDLQELSEYATFQLSLIDDYYKMADGICLPRLTDPEAQNGKILSSKLLINEVNQNLRVAGLFLGGSLLVDAGLSTPSYNGYVLGGNNGNGVCSDSLSTVYARWGGFSDSNGGIVKYLVTIGTVEKPSLYYERYDAGTNVAVALPTTIKGNATYRVAVTAYNFAGLSTTVTSKIVTVLGGGVPLFGYVYDGVTKGVQTSNQQGTTSLSASWTGWITEEHTAKNYNTFQYTENGFQYAVGEVGVSTTSVQGWTTSATWATSVTVTGLSLVSGRKYTITIRAQNCAGLYTQKSSTGVLIDNQPPVGGYVRYTNSSKNAFHRSTITLSDKINLRWWGFADYLSGLLGYEWAASEFAAPPSTSGSAGMLVAWTSVGMSTQITGPQLSTIPGTASLLNSNIYFHVKAIDKVGNFFIKTSNATMIVPN